MYGGDWAGWAFARINLTVWECIAASANITAQAQEINYSDNEIIYQYLLITEIMKTRKERIFHWL